MKHSGARGVILSDTPFHLMKNAFIFLLIGAIAGAVGWRYYERSQHPTFEQKVENVADKTHAAAVDAKDVVVTKAEDWKLTPENIKAEIAKTGRVVRSKAKVVGERIDDARIVAVIKGKYVVDSDLSVLAISVDCRDGEVKLTGSATSADHIARAVTVALQTSGVHHVVSQLEVRN